jgi:hypothetical protein
MSPSVRYTTQSSAYDRLLIGRPLTDRIIAKRMKQGYFGGVKSDERKELQMKSKKQKREVSRKVLRGLLADFKL